MSLKTISQSKFRKLSEDLFKDSFAVGPLPLMTMDLTRSTNVDSQVKISFKSAMKNKRELYYSN